MKKLMKLMTALLALVLAVSMTGCGRTEENKSADILHPLTTGAKIAKMSILLLFSFTFLIYVFINFSPTHFR